MKHYSIIDEDGATWIHESTMRAAGVRSLRDAKRVLRMEKAAGDNHPFRLVVRDDHDLTYTPTTTGTETSDFEVAWNALHRGHHVYVAMRGTRCATLYVSRQGSASSSPSCFVMVGASGTHSVDCDCTDAERLLAHVAGFAQNNHVGG